MRTGLECVEKCIFHILKSRWSVPHRSQVDAQSFVYRPHHKGLACSWSAPSSPGEVQKEWRKGLSHTTDSMGRTRDASDRLGKQQQRPGTRLLYGPGSRTARSILGSSKIWQAKLGSQSGPKGSWKGNMDQIIGGNSHEPFARRAREKRVKTFSRQLEEPGC